MLSLSYLVQVKDHVDAHSIDLHGFCTNPDRPICMMRGLCSALGVEIGAFSSQSLVRTSPDHVIEVRKQVSGGRGGEGRGGGGGEEHKRQRQRKRCGGVKVNWLLLCLPCRFSRQLMRTLTQVVAGRCGSVRAVGPLPLSWSTPSTRPEWP